MKKLISQSIFIIAVLSLSLLGCNKKSKHSHSNLNSFSQLKEWFADPPSEFRSAPLWDWNDSITKEGISFQLKEFKKAGIGGVFVHPRPGLITEYLSDEWHQLFDYTVQKGNELGMKVWIYDENSYPSGFAGGHVPAQMPDSYQHGTGLGVTVQNVFQPLLTDTFEVVLKQNGNAFENITPNFKEEIGREGTYYLFKRTYPAKSYWYGGKTYVDLLYPGVTEKFLEITMEGYEKYGENVFWESMPGIFTDEPNLEAAMSRGTVLRWTPDLWDAFQDRWDYDLKLELPSLIEEVGDWKKVRHDYYELLLELFIDRWAKPWSVYCDEKGLLWTGHYWEHGWPKPTHGFDEAAFYIWHQQPGVDMLGHEFVPEGYGGQFGNTRAVRELRSAANQAGRERTLSETYGGGGWEMDFRNMKRLADWQCVLGVNFVNQHLSYYTLKGVRKFDYPPSFSYHEPWWNNYKIMGDYLGRISMATAFGEQENSILVLQPNTTAWMYFSRLNPNNKIDSIGENFKHFIYQLEREHVEYDLGSENVLKALGRVDSGKLIVGKREYELVVIPEYMENIDRLTFDLLEQYLKGGGKVLSFNPRIERVDGAISEEVSLLVKNYSDQWTVMTGLDKAQEMFKTKGFAINELTDSCDLYHQRRILDDGQLLFFVNSDLNNKAIAEVSAKGESVVKLNLENGQYFQYPYIEKNGEVVFNVQLEPVGSALYFVSEKIESKPELPSSFTNTKIVEGTDISANRESENILVLDYLDLKTAKSEIKNTYFMDALIALFKENGIDFGNPWQHKIQYKKNYLELDNFSNDSGFEVDYRFNISNETNLSLLKNVKAVVEHPELWEVSINGINVGKVAGEYWIDKDFPVYKIGENLKQGQNTISLVADKMSIFAELMPIYIIGDFALKPDLKSFEIFNGELNSLGSWKDAGFPFYSQKVSYLRDFSIKKENSVFKVRLNKWEGTVVEVWVNNKQAGIIAWEPQELDVTSFLVDGENEIAVKVVGSLKNTFGFFYRDNNRWIFGPHDWNYAPKEQPSANQYFLMDYGMYEPFELVRMRK